MQKYRVVFWILCGVVVGRLVGCYLFSGHSVEHRLQALPAYYKENHTEPGDMAVAKLVASRTSVFCLILTEESRHETDLEPMDHAWIRRCNRRLLVSDVADGRFSTVAGGESQTSRLASGIAHLNQTLADSFDWFLLATDSTFVIMENLRHFLDGLNPEEAGYWGERYQMPGEGVFALRLEPGVVVSRTGLARLTESLKGVSSPEDSCLSEALAPGAALEKCFVAAHVPYKWSRDDEAKILFSYDEPMYFRWNASEYRLSDSLVSFHLYSRQPHKYERFIYHFIQFGGGKLIRNR